MTMVVADGLAHIWSHDICDRLVHIGSTPVHCYIWQCAWVLLPMGTLQWRHNGHDIVSNHQPHDCLLNRLSRRRSKKTSKLRVTGLCAGNSPGTGEFPHKWPVARKMFSFDDVIMLYCHLNIALWWYSVVFGTEWFLNRRCNHSNSQKYVSWKYGTYYWEIYL